MKLYASLFVLLYCFFVSKSQEQPSADCGVKLTEEEAIKISQWFAINATPIKLTEALRNHNIHVPDDYFSKVDEFGLYKNRRLTAAFLKAENRRKNLEKIKRDSIAFAGNQFTEEFAMTSSTSSIYYVPVHVWVHFDNNGNRAIPENEMLDKMGVAFETIREATGGTIELYIAGMSNLDDSQFFNLPDENDENDLFQFRALDRLNVHFISTGFAAGSANGIPSEDLWVGRNSSIETLIHEIGHCFNLKHTHQSHWLCVGDNDDCSNCFQESVSRTRTSGVGCVPNALQKKCETNGDQLCDTPADPNQNGFVGDDCIYDDPGRDEFDNWGDEWTPPTDNIMSLSSRPFFIQQCRTNFTLGQAAVMIKRVKNLRFVEVNPHQSITGPIGVLCPGSSYTFNPPDNDLEFYLWSTSEGLEVTGNIGNNAIITVDGAPPLQEESRWIYLNGIPHDVLSNNGGLFLFLPDDGYSVEKFGVKINDMKLLINGSGALPPDGNCRSYVTEYYPGAYYNWSISGGGASPPQICSGQGSNSVLLSAGAGAADFSLFVSTNISCGTVYGSKFVSVGNNDGGLPVPLEENSNRLGHIKPLPRNLMEQMLEGVPMEAKAGQISDVTIYDIITGKKLHEVQTLHIDEIEIIKNLGKGMYVIQYQFAEKAYSQKILIK